MIHCTIEDKKTTFETLAEAIAASRQADSEQKTIELDGGHYFLNAPIRLNSQDSGLTIRSSKDAPATLYGGKRITGWKKLDDNLWAAELPEVKSGDWDFRLLSVNDRFASRSRLPETGFFLHDTPFDVKWLSTVEGGWERPATDDELLTLKYNPADIGAWFDPKSAEISIYHMWDESLVGVADFDEDNHTIRFSNKPGYPPGAFSGQYEMEKRYVVWNLKEGMFKPGQWYLDKSEGRVVYWPESDIDMESAVIVAPTMDNIIVVEGTEDKPVEHITFENLQLSVTNAPLMTGAFGAKLFDGALSLQNIRHCELNGLSVFNVAGHGIRADGNDVTIQNCEIKFTGASAIRYTGGDSRIHNNYVHHVGCVFPSAIAIYVGMTDPNVPEEWEVWDRNRNVMITNNELHDTPYTAIACGGLKHKIEHNLIYRAMQNMYDGAGIYITFCEDIKVRYNHVRDIKKSAGAGTSAYYMDEHTVNSVLEYNISKDVTRPMHNHISHSNTIRNNVFIMNGEGYYTLERSRDYIFEKNIFISDNGFSIFDIRACKVFANNIFYCKHGELTAKELDMYQITDVHPLPLENNNLGQDPLIEYDEAGLIVFLENSPAFKLGIKPVDVHYAGRVKIKVYE